MKVNDGKTDITKMIELYKELAIKHREGSMNGNHRKANKAYEKLKKLFNELKDNSDLAEKVLSTLLINSDVRVRTWAAAHCLGLNKHIAEAERIFEEASQMENIGITSLNAQMTLKVWREQGYLEF